MLHCPIHPTNICICISSTGDRLVARRLPTFHRRKKKSWHITMTGDRVKSAVQLSKKSKSRHSRTSGQLFYLGRSHSGNKGKLEGVSVVKMTSWLQNLVTNWLKHFYNRTAFFSQNLSCYCALFYCFGRRREKRCIRMKWIQMCYEGFYNCIASQGSVSVGLCFKT